MRALVQDRYGSPGTLRLASLPKPTAGPGEVLVRVHAASLNPRDWHLMRGEPRLARLMDRRSFGRRGPRAPIRGTDFAGVVEAVGAGVTRCGPGERVFGEGNGAIAEYVVAPEQQVATMPPELSFAEAAALPLAGNTALTCLEAADPAVGQTLLVNGASGGVGTVLVQLAAERGLHTTAVCSAANADTMRALGAHDVIDYHREDFTTSGTTYDVVVDLVGNRSLRDLRRVVRRGGTLVLSGGGVSGQGRNVGPIGLLILAQVAQPALPFRVRAPLAHPRAEALDRLRDLVQTQALRPVVDRTYPLEDAAQAVAHLETAHARGKVVVAVKP